MAYEYAVYSTRTTFREPDFDWRLTWTVGPMFNVGPQNAAGITTSLRVGASGPYPSIEGRYRHWASAEQSADFMGGLAFYEVWSDANDRSTAMGVTAAAALASRDLMGVALRGEWLLTGGRPARALFIEGHVGSTLVPVAIVALLVAIFATYPSSS